MKKIPRIRLLACLCICLCMLSWPVWLWRDNILPRMSKKTSSTATSSIHTVLILEQLNVLGGLRDGASNTHVADYQASGGQVEARPIDTSSTSQAPPQMPSRASAVVSSSLTALSSSTLVSTSAPAISTLVSFATAGFGGGGGGGGSGAGGSVGGRDFDDETCPLTDPRP